MGLEGEEGVPEVSSLLRRSSSVIIPSSPSPEPCDEVALRNADHFSGFEHIGLVEFLSGPDDLHLKKCTEVDASTGRVRLLHGLNVSDDSLQDRIHDFLNGSGSLPASSF